VISYVCNGSCKTKICFSVPLSVKPMTQFSTHFSLINNNGKVITVLPALNSAKVLRTTYKDHQTFASIDKFGSNVWMEFFSFGVSTKTTYVHNYKDNAKLCCNRSKYVYMKILSLGVPILINRTNWRTTEGICDPFTPGPAAETSTFSATLLGIHHQ